MTSKINWSTFTGAVIATKKVTHLEKCGLCYKLSFYNFYTNLSFVSYNADASHEIGEADSYTNQSQLIAELGAQRKPFGARSSGSNPSHHQV